MSASANVRPEDLRPPRRSQVYWALADGLVLAKRNLVQIPRVPELLVFSTIQPVMFVLLFRYVFGGAIDVGATSYVDFLMAGIFVQTVAFGSMTTGVGLAEDLQKGLVDRFRSLPMARSAVLTGRTIADLARNAFVIVVMVVVGLLVGFRPEAGVTGWAAAIGLLLLFSFAFSWIAATIGLLVRSVEAVQQAEFIWLFPSPSPAARSCRPTACPAPSAPSPITNPHADHRRGARTPLRPARRVRGLAGPRLVRGHTPGLRAALDLALPVRCDTLTRAKPPYWVTHQGMLGSFATERRGTSTCSTRIHNVAGGSMSLTKDY